MRIVVLRDEDDPARMMEAIVLRQEGAYITVQVPMTSVSFLLRRREGANRFWGCLGGRNFYWEAEPQDSKAC